MSGQESIAWSSGNFKEILPDRLSYFSASTIPALFNEAFRRQYRRYGHGLDDEQLPVVEVFDQKPFFNLSALFRITERCWGLDGDVVVRAMGGRMACPPPPPLPAAQRPGPGLRAWRFTRAVWAALLAIWKVRRYEAVGVVASGLFDVRDELRVAETRMVDALLAHLCIGVLTTSLMDAAIAFLTRFNRGVDAADIQAALGDVGAAPSVRQHVEWMRLVSLAAEAGAGSQATTDDFERGLDDYLRNYGHRGIHEMEVARPRLREQRARVADEIRACAALRSATVPATPNRSESNPARQLIAGCGVFGPLARVLVWTARAGIVERERSKSVLAMRAAALRESVLAVASQCRPDGLSDEQDIFLLRREEVWRVALKQWTSVRVPVAARRRVVHEPPPDDFCSSGQRMVCDVEVTAGDAIELKGLAVSRGRVRGFVRLVRDAEDAATVRPGEIAVLRALDAGWNRLFSVAGGIVTEVGGMVSHAAILVREQNIPAVFNVAGAVGRLRDGDEVILDCGKAVIEIVSRGGDGEPGSVVSHD